MEASNIAITGTSGRFAKCTNVDEFKNNLFNGVDMVSDHHDRWNYKAMKTPPSLGIVPDLQYFDATFFGMNPKQVYNTDHRARKLLEVVFECIVDAGCNPSDLRGSRTGVFLAVSADDNQNKSGVNFLNRASSLMANIISYTYDLKGPSYALDTGCSTSIYALNQAVDCILLGSCDAAIVCATQTHLTPSDSAALFELQVLNPDGRCKTFDEDRRGYVKSDAIVAILVQKKENAKRIYGTIAGIGSNIDGYKEDGMMHPSSQMQMQLLKEIYGKFAINSNDVIYVECHGTGTLVGDIEECSSVHSFFCQNRKTPIMVGSAKSNAGHSESASGLVALVKVLISMHNGVIPGNLHFKKPALDIPGLADGSIKVVDKNTPFQDGLFAINSFGFGGTNSHVVLKPHLLNKNEIARPNNALIMFASGRTVQAVQTLLDKIQENKNNPEFLLLVNEVFGKPIDNHPFRGYTILSEETKNQTSEIKTCQSTDRPIWFVFSGMGSQWPGMAKDLMKFKVFRETLKKCSNAIKQYNMDLEDIILNGTEETFRDITNCFTALVAMSVGLTDLLKSFGITPDGVIGHSFGEIGCAYADGHITAEQATIIAYARGNATCTTKLISGAMAAIGMTVEECEKRLPSDIFIACKNSKDNLTISGPTAAVDTFVAKLQSEGFFAKGINTTNVAFHSPYIHKAGSKFLEFLKDVIKKATPRKKWLSSSIPEAEWNTELGRNTCAEYFYHNFINQVNFHQVLKHVPANAIVIEIAPRGLLQAVLRRSLPASVSKVSLLSNLHEDNVQFFLSSIGKVYLEGAQPTLESMFPKKEFPVKQGTPMLGPLIKWDHSVELVMPKYNPDSGFGKVIEIDMNKKENKFLTGHVVDGKIVFPLTGYVVTVWKAFASMHEKPIEEFPVVFEDIRVLNATVLSYKSNLSFVVNIVKTTGEFTMSRNKTTLATGKLRVPSDPVAEFLDYSNLDEGNKFECKMNSDDFYKELHLRGYVYEGIFRGVAESDINGASARLKWHNNYITFIDTILHNIVLYQYKSLFLPTNIAKIVIDPLLHAKSIDSKSEIQYEYNSFMSSARCGGVEIRNLLGKLVKPKASNQKVLRSEYKFIPYSITDKNQDALSTTLTNIIQLVIENKINTTKLNIVEVPSTKTKSVNYKKMITEVIHPRYLDTLAYNFVEHCTEPAKQTDLLIAPNILQEHENLLENFSTFFNYRTFIFTNISGSIDEAHLKIHKFSVIYKHNTGEKQYVLIRKTQKLSDNYTIIRTKNDNFNWLPSLKAALKKSQIDDSKIYIVTNEEYSGVVGLYNGLQQENLAAEVRIFNVKDENIEDFSMESSFYKEQIEKDLAVNVYSENSWGSYRILPLGALEDRLVKSAFLRVNNTGSEWIQQPIEKKESNVAIHYCGLGHWDSGLHTKKLVKLSNDLCLGFDYSGLDSSGNKVMGISFDGTFRTHLKSHPLLTWEIPSHINPEDAATIPLAYTMSYFGLIHKGNLKPRSSIFMLDPNNAISQATIMLGLSRQCEIYVETKSAEEKVELLKAVPLLNEKNIIVTKDDLRTREVLMQKTKGKGVDYLVNTTTDGIDKSLVQILASEGKIINISFDMSDQDLMELGNSCVLKKCALHNVTLKDVASASPLILQTMNTFISEHLQNGTIKPLKYQRAEKEHLPEIFNLLEKNITPIIVKLITKDTHFWGDKTQIFAKPRTYFNPNKSYIIVGGLGGFGLELCDWMLARGANKIILNSRSNIKNGYQAFCLKKWRNNSNIVLINTSDSTKFEGAESLIYQAASLGEIGGIFNVALVLENKLIDDLSIEDYEAVVAPKLYSAMHLDKLSRKLCHNLDHFVLFSSVVSSLGISGQTNYAYANSAMERLCEFRRKANLPGKAIEYGPVADVGYVSRMNLRGKLLGASPQRIKSCIEMLDEVLQLDCTVGSSCVYVKESEAEDSEEARSKSVVDLIAATFCIPDVDQINMSTTLLNLGMDSLMGMEIKNILSEKLNLDISVHDIRALSLKDVQNMEKAKNNRGPA